MNDIEKAINYWKQFKKEIKKLREIKPGAEWDEQEKATDLAISALEKQKSKKPKEQEINNSGDLIGLCSVCRKRWVNKYQKYCAECGTRLDWSVEE